MDLRIDEKNDRRMKRRILSAIALLALAIGCLPALADSLSAASADMPMLQRGHVPDAPRNETLCKFRERDGKACDMKCCEPQLPRGIGATPLVLGLTIAIARPANSVSTHTPFAPRAIFNSRDVSLPPPRTSLG